MDVIARLPGCDGQTADAVSAFFLRKKLEDAPRMAKIPKSECPDVWIRLPRHKWLQIMGKIEDPLVLLEPILYGHPSAGLLWERQFEEALLELGWEKIQSWECMFVHRKQRLFLSVFVDDITMAGQKQNVAPMCKKLMKIVDSDEPTSCLDRVYLGCTQRDCKPNATIIEQKTKMFESRISAGPTTWKAWSPRTMPSGMGIESRYMGATRYSRFYETHSTNLLCILEVEAERVQCVDVSTP